MTRQKGKLELQAIRQFQQSNYEAVRVIKQPIDLMLFNDNPNQSTSHINQSWYYQIVNATDGSIMHDHLTRDQLIETINRLFH